MDNIHREISSGIVLRDQAEEDQGLQDSECGIGKSKSTVDEIRVVKLGLGTAVENNAALDPAVHVVSVVKGNSGVAESDSVETFHGSILLGPFTALAVSRWARATNGAQLVR